MINPDPPHVHSSTGSSLSRSSNGSHGKAFLAQVKDDSLDRDRNFSIFLHASSARRVNEPYDTSF